MPDNSEFVKSVERVEKGILSIIADNMQEACLNVERTAKQNCPKDLGILAASIRRYYRWKGTGDRNRNQKADSPKDFKNQRRKSRS